MSRSRPAACRASWLPNSSKNDSRVSVWPRPPGLGAGALAVLPRTLGTSVWVDLPRNCLISTASTSMPGICAFKNSTTRSSGSGISSAMNSRRKRLAARFVATFSQKPSTSGSSSACISLPSTSPGLRPLAMVDASKVRRSSSAVQVCAAWAAYSSSWPTMVRRISGFEPRFTSASVGTASWSTIRWSIDHLAPDSRVSAMPFSRVMRIQRRGSPGRICCPSSSSGCSAISVCNSSSVAKGSSSRDSSPPSSPLVYIRSAMLQLQFGHTEVQTHNATRPLPPR